MTCPTKVKNRNYTPYFGSKILQAYEPAAELELLCQRIERKWRVQKVVAEIGLDAVAGVDLEAMIWNV